MTGLLRLDRTRYLIKLEPNGWFIAEINFECRTNVGEILDEKYSD